ncbi:MAG: 3'-5' exonuclease [Candidatus Eremiobacteraeota bacterium]|nr:3'-5' exonuclease [Candidatus Eremiobacteraeota bacterium]
MRLQGLEDARYAFIDVETTGFHPSYARVVELACIVVEHRQVTASLETLIDPQIPIPRFATEIHGITDARVRGKPSLEAIRDQLLAQCREATVVAHNAPFDLSFLPFLRSRPIACSY